MEIDHLTNLLEHFPMNVIFIKKLNEIKSKNKIDYTFF